MDLFIQISLTFDAALSLCQITGTPGTIQIMDCHKPVLYVGASAHLCGTAQQNTNLTGADLSEQLFLFSLRIGIVDESNLFRGNALGNQLGANILVDSKGLGNSAEGIKHCAFGFYGSLGCGNVTEYQLRQLVRFTVFPHLQDIPYTEIDLAFRVVRESGVDDPLVKPQLPSVAGDLQHIVNIRGNGATMNQGRTFRKLLNKLPLNFAGFGGNIVVLNFRHRKVQLIRSLNIRNLPENVHQLRQIEESTESCPGAVAFSLRGKLQRGNGFTKPGGPTVEMDHAHFLQAVILQIPLHSVQLRHGIGYRCTRGENHAPASGKFIHVAALGEHIAGLLGI